MNMSQPLVYIGLVLYNSRTDLPVCLEALRQLTYPHIQLVALNNASPDDSADWLMHHAPEMLLLHSTLNLGYGRGHNRIVAELQLDAEDYYLPLNPDVILDADYVSLLIEALIRTGAGWGIGKLRKMNASGAPTGLLYSAGQGVRRDGYIINVGENLPESTFNEEREVFAASGAAMLIRASMMRDLVLDEELFDAYMFMYAEDIDLGWRARRRGWRCLYLPQATALHRGGTLSPKMRVQALGNTYLSTIKNAYLIDLITVNLPIIALNCIVRFVVSPHRGAALIRQVVHGAKPMWRKRQVPFVKRRDMLVWFAWSGQQLTQQPTSMWSRLTRYLR